MNKEIEDLALKILNNEIYGKALQEEIDLPDANLMELQLILHLKQFMESNYLVLNSKNKDTATGRLNFAKEVYEDMILPDSQHYSQTILDKIKEVFENTQKEFAAREFD